MTNLINLRNRNDLERAADRQHQAILIGGEQGLNLVEAAKYFANKLGADLSEVKPIDRATGKTDMSSGKILVPLIRDLYESTRSKHRHPQAVILHSAHTMTPAAQGAFLKLLEEPPQNTHFILLSEHPNRLLPTILSRVSNITLQKISSDQSRELLKSLGVTDPKKIQQIMFIAEGLPTKLHRLATDEDYFESEADMMTTAKQIIRAGTYEKLVAINKFKDNRAAAIEIVDKAMLIIRKTLAMQPEDRLVKQLGTLLVAKEQLQANGNIRLALMLATL